MKGKFGMTSPSEHPQDPLHGMTLEKILTQLVEDHGWERMGRKIKVRCFQVDPSIKSSLTFLRKTPWAREKVERWFIADRYRKLRSNLTEENQDNEKRKPD